MRQLLIFAILVSGWVNAQTRWCDNTFTLNGVEYTTIGKFTNPEIWPCESLTVADQISDDISLSWNALTQSNVNLLAIIDEIRNPIRGLSPYRLIDVQDNMSFIRAFVQEAFDWGIDIRRDYEVMLTSPYAVSLNAQPNGDTAIGTAYKVDNRYEVQIILNETYYRDVTFAGGMKIMWHEFGHDFLDLAHTTQGVMTSDYDLDKGEFLELRDLFWSHYVWAAYNNFSSYDNHILRDPVHPRSPNHANNWRPNYLVPRNTVTEVGPDWIKVSGNTDSFARGGLAMYDIDAWGTPSAGVIDRIVGDKIYIKGALKEDNRVATKPYERMFRSMNIPPQGMPVVGQRILLTKRRL